MNKKFLLKLHPPRGRGSGASEVLYWSYSEHASFLLKNFFFNKSVYLTKLTEYIVMISKGSFLKNSKFYDYSSVSARLDFCQLLILHKLDQKYDIFGKIFYSLEFKWKLD